MPEAPHDDVLRTTPDDDVGALTQARFRYQADCAAQDCIRMLADKGPVAIVCEWHEDYIVLFSDQAPEIVSVKHRESSQGPWTLATLISDGGLSHLVSRWLRFDRLPRPRLCTNAGLRTGPWEAGALARACAAEHEEEITEFAQRVAGRLAVTADVARAFLTLLRIDDDRPKRKDIAGIQAVQLRTVLRRFGLDTTKDLVYYERLVEAVLRASRDDPLPPAAVLAHLNQPDALSARALRDRRLAGRIIERNDLLGLLRDPVNDRDDRVPPPTRLRLKLEAGGFGPTAVHRAQRLRAAWYAYSRAQQDGAAAQLEDIRDHVHDEAAACEARHGSESPYGLRMAANLRDVLDPANPALPQQVEVTQRLLLGCAFQLTDECQVWWSPEREVKEQ